MRLSTLVGNLAFGLCGLLAWLYAVDLTDSLPHAEARVASLPWTPNRAHGDIGWRARAEHARHDALSGVTCHNGLPEIEPLDSAIVGRERDENQLHEAMHREQFVANCDSMMTLWNNVPYIRLELEAEATCTGLQVWLVDSVWRYRRGLAVRRISQANGIDLAFEDIWSAVDRWCIAPNGSKP